MISANGVEYKNLPEQVQYLTERAAEFAVELGRISASVESVAGDVAALQTSYTTLAEDVRVAKININTLFVNFGTAFTEITNIKNGTTPLFETITDRHGNKRFVEGNGIANEIEGVTPLYNKWSLSGTHLMLVYAFKLDSGYSIPYVVLSYFSVPTWIYNKINVLFGSSSISDIESHFTNLSNNQQAEVLPIRVMKYDNNIRFMLNGSIGSKDYDRVVRIQFDLLIDAS